jgi:hypothetical protein
MTAQIAIEGAQHPRGRRALALLPQKWNGACTLKMATVNKLQTRRYELNKPHLWGAAARLRML